MCQLRSFPVASTGLVGLLLIGSLAPSRCPAQPPRTAPDVGVRFQPPQEILLTGAQIVTAAGKSPTQASLLIRAGKIAAIGNQLPAVAGAEVIDCTGKYIYPAFVDALVEVAAETPPTLAGNWNRQITPERRLAQVWQRDKAQLEKLRKAGVGTMLAAPSGGLIKGQSCVLSTADAPLAETLLRSDVWQHMRLYPSRGQSDGYPNSPMGATALVRQTLYDADWYQRARQAASTQRGLPRPDFDSSLEALQAVIRGEQTVIIDGSNELYALRADRVAREFSLQLVIRGSGREYRQLDALAATGRPMIIPVDFPAPPNLATESDMVDASLQTLMDWHLAPENPARLASAGIPFVITTDGLSNPGELLVKLRAAISAGLDEDKALEVLTIEPAELLGVAQLVGSLEAGKLASFLICDGPLFAKESQIVETWVQGHRDSWQPRMEADPRGTWQLTADPPADQWQLEISGKPDKLTGKVSGQGATVDLKDIQYDEYQLTGVFVADQVAQRGSGRAWLTAVLRTLPDATPHLQVHIVWPDGSSSRLQGKPQAADSRADNSTSADASQDAAQDTAEDPAQASGERPPSPRTTRRPAPRPAPRPDKRPQSASDSGDQLAASRNSLDCPVTFPLGAYGRTAAPEQPAQLLIKNATLWTCDEAGILEGADMLVERGIIREVGHGLSAADDAVVVDARGWHVSPGIIDCHSHMATDGGVNESGQAVTAEVRIADFIDCNDITIYRQLAGGVTAANILHGSANPIGGQNQVIKLRWGSLDEELKMREAPAGIKFALGENVKQSNRSGSSSRYPQSRMGVEQLLRDRFEAAREYRRQWQQWPSATQGLPPRRDLELEAIAEILDGQRWVHCHSYRQDEILMVLQVLDDYQVTIGSLQHILEGYKVADAMAAHGATGSSFSDWWAYKMEVFDAIPYNGALMHRAGVVVSFNSDDAELARHLNHEAAKAMKYGGLPAAEALKFVTLNPARQLRIDRWVGSLTPGKQADFVIWNRSPLSTLSMCLQTWIDGRKYFDRQEDLELRQRDEQLRMKLIQLAVAEGGKSQAASEDRDPSLWWVRYDEFCHHAHDDHDDHHDHDHSVHD